MDTAMYRKIMFLAAMTGILALAVSCASYSNNDSTFADLASYMAKHGIELNRVQLLNHYVVGASSAMEFISGPRGVGIYKFNTSLKKQKERLERIKTTGVMYVVGKKFKALVNGSFVMIDYDTHPDAARLEKVFMEFRPAPENIPE